jgi:hypothetical protein
MLQINTEAEEYTPLLGNSSVKERDFRKKRSGHIIATS